MRVVVIGATGNLGKGILRRLHAAGAEIVGVARRMPDASLEPYAGVTWRLADIGAAGAVAGLAVTMRGALRSLAQVCRHMLWLLYSMLEGPSPRLSRFVPGLADGARAGAGLTGPRTPPDPHRAARWRPVEASPLRVFRGTLLIYDSLFSIDWRQ